MCSVLQQNNKYSALTAIRDVNYSLLCRGHFRCARCFLASLLKFSWGATGFNAYALDWCILNLFLIF